VATILVVDDNLASLNVLVALLEHAGHTLLQASNADDGLLLVREQHPDLVISDIIIAKR
jgi:CheY-like chemotaxis protein